MDVTSHRTEVDAARLLVDAVHRLSVCRTNAEIIAIVTRATRLGTGADGASFVLPEDGQCHYVDEDAIAPLWKGRRFPMTSCVSGWAIRHCARVVIPDIAKDPRVLPDMYQPSFVRALVVVPIRSREPFGAIAAYWAQPQAIPTPVVDWLQALADAACAGLEAVRAHQEIEQLRRNSNPPMPAADRTVRMCAWTRRIWHNGQWLTIEAYLHDRFGLDVTHGMSEDAKEKMLADLAPPKPQSASPFAAH